MQLSKLNIRNFYRSNRSSNTKNNILFENALSSITTTSRLSRPLVEDYFNTCTNYENANMYNDNLIALLERVMEENKPSLYNKLEGIYINNIIPRLENANIKATINILEHSNLKDTRIISELKDYLVCDRIINNYNKLDKKFNIDESINISAYRDKDECIYNICEDISKYNLSLSSKYNIALESIIYGYFKNNIDFSTERIVEDVTDFFLLEDTISDKDYISMKDVLNYNVFITEQSKSNIRYFVNESGDKFKTELKKLLKNKDLNIEQYKLVKELYESKDATQAKSAIRKVLDYILKAYVVINTAALGLGALAGGAVIVTTLTAGILGVLIYAVALVSGCFAIKGLDMIIAGMEKAMKNTSKYSKDKALDVIKRCKSHKDNHYIKESEDFADSDDVKSLLQKYKTEQIKSDGKLKYYIKKIYVKDPSQIIDETPNFLAWIRMGFVLSTVTFNPIIMIPLFIVDQFIAMDFKRKDAEKMVNTFRKELKKMESKKSSKKVDSYIKCLNQCITKLEVYQDSLYSDKENDKRLGLDESVNNLDNLISISEVVDKSDTISRELNSVFKKIPKSVENLIDKDLINSFNKSSVLEFVNSDNLLDFNIVQLKDTSYEEAESITESIDRALPKNYVALLESSNEGLSIHAIRKNRLLLDEEEKNTLQNTIPYDLKGSFTSIINISESMQELVSLEPQSLTNRIEDGFDKLMEDPVRSCILMNACSSIIDKEKIDSLMDNVIESSDPIRSTTLLSAKRELYKEHIEFPDNIQLIFVSEAVKQLDAILEGVSTKSLKTAALNLKKKAVNLSVKEKEISRNMDITMSGLQKSIEKALTTDKREAIIKGSIIPSFSKILKFAIAATGTYLISPALAVIGVIGTLAVSKSLTHRERKLLLDEIDVELKVLEKQISACEDNNPNKYRQLLTYQRKLEREKMRIKYNLSKDRQVVPGVNIVTDKERD